MPKFSVDLMLSDEYDHMALMDHMEGMYVDTHNIFFLVAILAICDEYNVTLNDYLAGRLARHHLIGIFDIEFEGRNLQRFMGLDKPSMKRKQFEDLWDPSSPKLALWYPKQLIDLVLNTRSETQDIEEAFRQVAKLLGCSSSSVRAKYYHADKGLDFLRRIDHPDHNNSYCVEYWDELYDYFDDIPVSRTN